MEKVNKSSNNGARYVNKNEYQTLPNIHCVHWCDWPSTGQSDPQLQLELVPAALGIAQSHPGPPRPTWNNGPRTISNWQSGQLLCTLYWKTRTTQSRLARMRHRSRTHQINARSWPTLWEGKNPRLVCHINLYQNTFLTFGLTEMFCLFQIIESLHLPNLTLHWTRSQLIYVIGPRPSGSSISVDRTKQCNGNLFSLFHHTQTVINLVLVTLTLSWNLGLVFLARGRTNHCKE